MRKFIQGQYLVLNYGLDNYRANNQRIIDEANRLEIDCQIDLDRSDNMIVEYVIRENTFTTCESMLVKLKEAHKGFKEQFIWQGKGTCR